MYCDFSYRWDNNGYCIEDTTPKCPEFKIFDCPEGTYFDVMKNGGCEGCPEGVCVKVGETVEDMMKAHEELEKAGKATPGSMEGMPSMNNVDEHSSEPAADGSAMPMPDDSMEGASIGTAAAVGMVLITVGVLGMVLYLGERRSRTNASVLVTYRQVPQDPEMVSAIKY
jgi:hypothetical protein